MNEFLDMLYDEKHIAMDLVRVFEGIESHIACSTCGQSESEVKARIGLKNARDRVERSTRMIAAYLNTHHGRKHVYWGAGEVNCPQDIKAPNGELHTLRCKVCGQDNPSGGCAV